MSYHYLSVGNDAKTIKGQKKGYLTGILYLAPATVAGGPTVCPFSTAGCRRVCLYTAGRGGFNIVQQARIRKTREFQADPLAFVEKLKEDVATLVKEAKQRGLRPAVRLNGTSDILWEKFDIIQSFPRVPFYDYTKYPPMLRRKLPRNYKLTHSFSEKGPAVKWARGWWRRGSNVAVVFFGGLPKKFLGRRVIDGDLSDLRFRDPKGVVVGLKVKGKARNDDGDGFVQKAAA